MTIPQLKPLMISALLVLLTVATATAQEWHFERLAREALAHHPSITAKLRSEEAAGAEAEAARWQRWPTPGVEASKDTDGNNLITFSLQQPLWTGGRITAGIDGADARREAARETVQETRRQILLRLVDVYAEVQRRRNQQKVLGDTVRQQERLLEMIKRRVEQQISPQVDSDLARSRLYQAVNDLSVVVQALQNGLTRLSELVGQPVNSVPESFDPSFAGLPSNRQEILSLAVTASPALAVLGYELTAAEADVRVERSGWWPKLAVRGERSEGRFSEQRAMLVLETQLGSGLTSFSRVDAASSRRESLAQQRLAAMRELEVEVGDAWQQLQASRLRLENSSLNSKSAVTVFESYTRQYVVGQKSWLDLLNSVREANQAALAVEDARAESLRSAMRLLVMTGRYALK